MTRPGKPKPKAVKLVSAELVANPHIRLKRCHPCPFMYSIEKVAENGDAALYFCPHSKSCSGFRSNVLFRVPVIGEDRE